MHVGDDSTGVDDIAAKDAAFGQVKVDRVDSEIEPACSLGIYSRPRSTSSAHSFRCRLETRVTFLAVNCHETLHTTSVHDLRPTPRITVGCRLEAIPEAAGPASGQTGIGLTGAPDLP